MPHYAATPGPTPLQHLTPPSTSHATHLSLRRDSRAVPHPLKQNPIASYANDQDLGAFDDINLSDPIRAPPSALTAATAYDPHATHSPFEQHSSPVPNHQRSLTDTFFNNCQPLLHKATSTIQQHTSRPSLQSPTKAIASFIPSRAALETTATASTPKIRAGAQAISNWFNGSSAPVQLGLGPRDFSDDEYDSEEDEVDGSMMAGIFNRAPALTRASTESSPKPSATTSQTPTASSKFAWLLSTQKNAINPTSTPSPSYHDPDDELLNLNITESLFPHGAVDPLAPSSFHDLLSNAESLLTRYQKSYRQMSSALDDARAEQSAQDDELDEAETRVRHLKMQLETMAARANDQDEQMRRLMEDLLFEKRARQEEEAARTKSLALVRESKSALGNDEALSPKRRARISNSNVSVDSGFESECETDAASVFSRTNGAMSPTDTVSSTSDAEGNDTTPKGKRPQPTQRRSTYDKVRDGTVNLEKGGWGCQNCEGGAQAAVWGRLAKEREENGALRRRVHTLEEAVEGALNVVDGPWGM
ncbi:hypothetical protein EJ04DRAFT_513128 [Polyplosphaeria fusca]|uniref:Uncharacterized protein n=1 Tax=Polyplosphaeria fusca TaxID=682080 RepID=A0A9P4QVZ6_9PLEO|nr:hypothetical protein EJ04DRAFT_513128 [Polyplosphaeria fusca]